jgi:hypothetical protein
MAKIDRVFAESTIEFFQIERSTFFRLGGRNQAEYAVQLLGSISWQHLFADLKQPNPDRNSLSHWKYFALIGLQGKLG